MRLTDFLTDVGSPVAYLPGLRKITKSVTATVLMCQLLYWHDRTSDPDGWVYKNSHELEEETGLTYEEQLTARKKLVRLGFLEEKTKRLERRVYFRLNLDAINEAWENRETAAPQSTSGENPAGQDANTQPANGQNPVVHAAKTQSTSGQNPVVRDGKTQSLIHILPKTTTQTTTQSTAQTAGMIEQLTLLDGVTAGADENRIDAGGAKEKDFAPTTSTGFKSNSSSTDLHENSNTGFETRVGQKTQKTLNGRPAGQDEVRIAKQALADAFQRASGLRPGVDVAWGLWNKGIRHLFERGATPALIAEAVAYMRDQGLTIKSPASIDFYLNRTQARMAGQASDVTVTEPVFTGAINDNYGGFYV